MSDISIPGVSSKYNTQELIDKLMEIERRPLEAAQGKIETYKEQKAAWQDINRAIGRLSTSSNRLFGFQNPFNERVADSSDESVITAAATREAFEESKEIIVKRKAGADRFLSSSLPRDFAVPAGEYIFSVGDTEVGFRFKGGSLLAFAEAVNTRGKGVLGATVVNDTPTTSVILIESKKTGSGNSLVFKEAAADFGLSSGMLERVYGSTRDVDLSVSGIRRWEKELDPESIVIRDGVLTLKPGVSMRLPITPPVQANENFVMEFEVSVRNLPYDDSTPSPPDGPSIPPTGSVDFRGISVRNDPLRVDIPQWDPPPPPPRVDDLSVFFLTADGKTTALPSLEETAGTRTIRISLSDFGSVSSLDLRNRNTHREIEISNIRVFDPTARGEYSPANAVSEAADALIVVDGIQVTRSTNSIDDLIPGVTLEIKRAKPDPVTLTIQPDRELVKNAIIEFVGEYNRLMADINIYTGRNESIITELEYLSDQEREEAYANLGLFQGEIALMQLESRLKTIMMNAYPTSLGNDLSMLVQIGISTNSSGSGSGIEGSRLRGYLEINEAKLDEALQNRLTVIKELFGFDTDSDLAIDTGVAYQMERYVRGYAGTGGIIPSRVGTIDSRISTEDRNIETLTKKLERVEAQYRKQYGIMESSLQNLEESSKQIESFNNSNSR